MTPSVLVTGAAGFIGRAVVEAVAAARWTVWPVVHRPVGYPREIVVDLDDLVGGGNIQEFPRVDAVVHLAARVRWEGVSRIALLVPNVLATGVLAAQANARFIYSSTITVCGAQAPIINPESPVSPDTDYGYSKWLGEEVVRMSGVHCAILRIAGVFGLGGPTHLGLNRAISAVLGGAHPLLVGDGLGRRNYIYVHDVAECIVACLRDHIQGTHLVAGRSTHTIAEMIQIVCDELLSGCPLERESGDSGRDQIVAHSPALPQGREFREAIRDIAGRARRCA